MADYRLVTPERHATHRWRSVDDYSFLASQALAPIIMSELQRVCLAMPMGFVKSGEGFRLVAVMSLVPGRNAFVEGKTWIGRYLPAMYRGLPFQLLRSEGKDQRALGIDEASPFFGTVESLGAAGLAFFDDAGKPTQQVQASFQFLLEAEKSLALTDFAVAALAEAKILTPWEIKIQSPHGDRQVSGLFRVDETALNALADESFLRLKKASALPIAYAQLISTGQIDALQRAMILKAAVDLFDKSESEVTLGSQDLPRVLN